MKNIVNKTVANYWVKHYVGPAGVCVLCGNTGIVDTTGSAVSVSFGKVGRKDFCFCPNGQHERADKGKAR